MKAASALRWPESKEKELNIEDLRNSIDYINDGATRGASACAARATSKNIQLSIFNIKFSAAGGSGLG